MKQYKIIQAYNATEGMSKCDKLSADTLWSVYQLRKKLYPHVEFQQEREQALKEKYSKFADEEGLVSGKPYQDFLKDLEELANLDKEIEFEKIQIKIQDEMGITVQMMEALEDFIEFTK